MVRKDLLKFKKYLGEKRSCIICKKKDFEIWATLDDFTAQKCKNCGMISMNPSLTQEGLLLYYSDYLTNRLTSEKTLYEQRQQAYLIDRNWILNFIDSGKVLDVGCSGGQFLSTFDNVKWSKLGVDIEQSDADFAKKNFGINIRVGDLTKLVWEEKFDLVMMRGVIEHILEPISYLKKCCELVKPGGFLYITATPMADSFAFFVYREKWIMFNPPEHLHFFTLDILTSLLEKEGFELLNFHYQYQETPYANIEEDYKKLFHDIQLINEGNKCEISTSVPFLGSLLTAVWKKTNF